MSILIKLELICTSFIIHVMLLYIGQMYKNSISYMCLSLVTYLMNFKNIVSSNMLKILVGLKIHILSK